MWYEVPYVVTFSACFQDKMLNTVDPKILKW